MQTNVHMLQKRGDTRKSAPRHAPWENRFSVGNLCPILGLKKSTQQSLQSCRCVLEVRCQHPADNSLTVYHQEFAGLRRTYRMGEFETVLQTSTVESEQSSIPVVQN